MLERTKSPSITEIKGPLLPVQLLGHHCLLEPSDDLVLLKPTSDYDANTGIFVCFLREIPWKITHSSWWVSCLFLFWIDCDAQGILGTLTHCQCILSVCTFLSLELLQISSFSFSHLPATHFCLLLSPATHLQARPQLNLFKGNWIISWWLLSSLKWESVPLW